MFGRFLKVRPDCARCGLEMHHHRADDLPPYIVIFVVAHIVGYAILETELGYDVPLWFQMTFWPLVTLGMALGLLQPAKGAVVGLQYALGMHGFAKLPPRPTGEAPAGGEDARRESAEALGSTPGLRSTPGLGTGQEVGSADARVSGGEPHLGRA